MTTDTDLTFYHSPRTRSSGALALLEELDASYRLHVLNMKIGEHKKPEYLAVNPLGKVPAIVHNGALVTEQVAIYIYLADAFPQRKLAPAIGDPLRGPYLRWLAFYGSAFEPAVIDRYRKLDPGAPGMTPYGSFEAVMTLIETQLAAGPWLFGERFTAADILWGSALNWTSMFGIVEATPVISGYIARVCERDSFKNVAKTDAQLAAVHEAAAAKG